MNTEKKPSIAMGVFGGLALFFIGLPLAILAVLVAMAALQTLPSQPADADVAPSTLWDVIAGVVLLYLALRHGPRIVKNVWAFMPKSKSKPREASAFYAAQPYFFSIDGVDSGPHSLEEMRQLRESGSLTDETLVIKLGDSEWQPATMFPEIVF